MGVREKMPEMKQFLFLTAVVIVLTLYGSVKVIRQYGYDKNDVLGCLLGVACIWYFFIRGSVNYFLGLELFAYNLMALVPFGVAWICRGLREIYKIEFNRTGNRALVKPFKRMKKGYEYSFFVSFVLVAMEVLTFFTGTYLW